MKKPRIAPTILLLVLLMINIRMDVKSSDTVDVVAHDLLSVKTEFVAKNGSKSLEQDKPSETEEVEEVEEVAFVEETVEQPIETSSDTPKIEPQSTKTTEVVKVPTNTKTFRVTAYCACVQCCGKTDGITASGTKATAGRTIAVDPSIYPYGTQIVFNGNTYIAEDCGGAIKGDRIDMYFDSHEEALAFGVQYLEGTVISDAY